MQNILYEVIIIIDRLCLTCILDFGKKPLFKGQGWFFTSCSTNLCRYIIISSSSIYYY